MALSTATATSWIVPTTAVFDTYPSTINGGLTLQGTWTVHSYTGQLNGGLTIASTGHLLLTDNGELNISDPVGISNSGIIDFTSTNGSGLAVIGGGTLVNETAGTITSLSDSGHLIAAKLNDKGTLEAKVPLTVTGSALTNSGVIIASTGDLTFSVSALNSIGSITVNLCCALGGPGTPNTRGFLHL